jgi:hypothetical protein
MTVGSWVRDVARGLKELTVLGAVAHLLVGAAAAQDGGGGGGGGGQGGTIAGTVLAADQSAPLAWATVSITQLSSPVTAVGEPEFARDRTAITSGDGTYRFTELTPAQYRLHIRRIGYYPATIEVELKQPKSVTVSAALEVAPVQLERLVVKGITPDKYARTTDGDVSAGQKRIEIERWRQKAFLGSDVRALTHADVLEAVTLGTADPLRALQRLPGVTTRDSWTAEVWTRGASWGQTRVYFDDLPLLNPLHAGGVTSAVNEDVLGSVLFHPGVRPVTLGEGAAGVVHLRSRPAGGSGDLRGHVGAALFSAGLTLERRFSRGRIGALLGGRRSTLEGPNWEHLPQEFGDFAGRFDVDLGRDWSIEASGLWERDWINTDLPDGPRGNQFAWGNAVGRLTFDGPVPGANARHTAGFSQFDLSVRQYRSAASIDRFNSHNPTQGNTNGRINHFILSGEFGSVSPEQDVDGWRAGYQLMHRLLKYDGAPISPYPIQTFLGPLSLQQDLTVGSLWGEARWKPANGLTALGGIRVEASGSIRNGGRVRLAPHISVRYAVSERWSLSAGVGRTYQYLQLLAQAGLSVGPGLPTSHVWLLAGRDTPAARSDVVSLGAERWLSDRWLTSAALYLRRVAGITLVDPTPGPLPARPNTVVGESGARGFEVSLRRLAGSFTMSASYSLGVSEIRAAGLRFPAPSDRSHAIDATGTWRVPRKIVGGAIRIGSAFTAMSGAPYTPLYPGSYECDYVLDRCRELVSDIIGEPNSARSPWYGNLDLLFDWNRAFSAWKLGFFVQLHNVFRRDNAVTYSVTREGPCHRDTGDAPFCSRQQDLFRPDLPAVTTAGLRISF